MPLWSIGEWRARIGSSWCALGRPFKIRSPFRGGGERVLRALTQTDVVTMIIVLMAFIGINFGLQKLVMMGYNYSLESYIEFDDSSLLQKFYLINCGLLLTLIIPIVKFTAPLVYHSLPCAFQNYLRQFYGGLLWYSLLACNFVIRWLVLPILRIITPLVADINTSLTGYCHGLLEHLHYGTNFINQLTLLVLYTQDWQGTLWYSMKPTAMILTKSSSCVDNMAVLANIKTVFNCILVLIKALLDAIASVAASVIFSRLLISGDIESNPGPELDYNNVDANQILGEDDLPDVLEEIHSIKYAYLPLGQWLRLSNDDLKAIHEAYTDESMSDQALKDVLLLWLNQKYKVERFGLPTWRMLVEAVDKKTGGNNHELAKEIASNHPTALTPDNIKEMLDLTWDYRSKWKFIGIELGIDTGTLDTIDMDNRKAEQCLMELITLWLRGTSSRPNRRVMIDALQSSRVAGGATPIKKACDVKPDTTNDKLKQYALYLRSLYWSKSRVSSAFYQDQWPPPLTKKVFHLAMVKTERLRMENMEDEFLRQKTISGKVDTVLEQSATIELEDIFQETDQQRLVLIDGAPGSGKSTLSLHICHLWSEGKLFQEYKLVILVRLRDPAVQNAKSIVNLLPCQGETVAHDIEKLMKENNGDDVLFVLDGWDEMPQSTSGHALILNLIDRTHLHGSSIIITSRPTSSANLHPLVSSRIEILGFTQDELRRYFSDCLQDNALAVETLLKKISENPAVEGSCYLPVNASVIVHLFKCEENVMHFFTQYSIFSALIRNLIVRHLRKNGLHEEIPSLKSLDELPELIYGPFKDICELAYHGVVNDKVTFDVEFSSGFYTLGLLQGVESFAGCGISHSYNFLHLSIQELLAACHIATQFRPSKQTAMFKELLDQPRFNAVFGFYAAKTKLQMPGIMDVVMKIVGKCTVEDPQPEHKTQLVSLFRCLFEAQDPSLCQLVVEQQVRYTLSFENIIRFITSGLPDHISVLDLSRTSLNPMDCLAIGYFLTSIHSDLDVNLQSCLIGVEGSKALFRAKGHPYHIRKLDLWGNSIGAEGAVALAECMKTMSNLQTLDLGMNSKIGEEGAVAIAVAMKTIKNLHKLSLSRNSIGDEGAVAIAEAMKTTSNLQELDLSGNYISDIGAMAIAEVMKTTKNLQQLHLWNNVMGKVGRGALSAAAIQTGKSIWYQAEDTLEWPGDEANLKAEDDSDEDVQSHRTVAQ